MDSLVESITKLASTLTSLMMVFAMFKNYFPSVDLCGPLKRYSQKLHDFFYPYMNITIPEYQSDTFERSKAYAAVERYLNANSTNQAKRLNANTVKDSENVVLTMAHDEEVLDEYQGIKLEWTSQQFTSNSQSFSFYPRSGGDDEKRFYSLKFHSKYRKIITENYLKHVLEEGKAIAVKERRRKLFTNNKSDGWFSRRNWTQVPFQHPASFDTLAMDPAKKKDIIDDLTKFTQGKEYYEKIGKAWKRGYLLYGPPGTGKSTMIAAMANFLKYDIYDLELTSVRDNLQLRKLLIDTSSKSIVVIEDIDCSIDLTGKRGKKKKEDEEVGSDPVKDRLKSVEDSKSTDVTLSGLLNFIDGLWSACVGERIVVFTTNHLEKLDPALIRRGRMDKHIEMSYCCFESFKILAKNYLDLDSHELFDKVKVMLEETNMTPADVAENLLPKLGGEDSAVCLTRLIKALEEAKEAAKRKAEEEEKQKAEKLAKEEEEKAKAEEEKKKKEEKSAQEGNEEKPSEDAALKTKEEEKEKADNSGEKKKKKKKKEKKKEKEKQDGVGVT